MTDITASVKWLPNSRFNHGDRILMRDGTIWVCVAPGVSCSNWREEAFQIPDGSIVDGSVIWRTVERVEADESAPRPESSDSEPDRESENPGSELDAEQEIEGVLADGFGAGDTGDAYIILVENVTSENDD